MPQTYDASRAHRAAKKLSAEVHQYLDQLGGELNVIREKGAYSAAGYDDFGTYTNSELGIELAEALDLIARHKASRSGR